MAVYFEVGNERNFPVSSYKLVRNRIVLYANVKLGTACCKFQRGSEFLEFFLPAGEVSRFETLVLFGNPIRVMPEPLSARRLLE